MKIIIFLLLTLSTTVTNSGYLPEILYKCKSELDWQHKEYSLEFSFDDKDQFKIKTFKKEQMLHSCLGKVNIPNNPFKSRSATLVVDWSELECEEILKQNVLKVEQNGFHKLSFSHFKKSFVSINGQMNSQECITNALNKKKLFHWLRKKFP